MLCLTQNFVIDVHLSLIDAATSQPCLIPLNGLIFWGQLMILFCVFFCVLTASSWCWNCLHLTCCFETSNRKMENECGTVFDKQSTENHHAEVMILMHDCLSNQRCQVWKEIKSMSDRLYEAKLFIRRYFLHFFLHTNLTNATDVRVFIFAIDCAVKCHIGLYNSAPAGSSTCSRYSSKAGKALLKAVSVLLASFFLAAFMINSTWAENAFHF